MRNLPKFLICHNEAAKPGITYILHTKDPSFIAKIHKFPSPEAIDEFKEKVGHTNYFYIKDYLLGVEVEQFFNEFTQMPKNWTWLLKRTLSWYIHAQGGR